MIISLQDEGFGTDLEEYFADKPTNFSKREMKQQFKSGQ
jgi:hypothetical protein